MDITASERVKLTTELIEDAMGNLIEALEGSVVGTSIDETGISSGPDKATKGARQTTWQEVFASCCMAALSAALLCWPIFAGALFAQQQLPPPDSPPLPPPEQ